MSLFRAPIRRLLATAPTRAVAATKTTTVTPPAFSRPFNLRSYSTPPPTEAPTNPHSSPAITPAASYSDPSSTAPASSSSSSTFVKSGGAVGTAGPPPQLPPPQVPQGYRGPNRNPTRIAAPIPPYRPVPPDLPYHVQRSRTNHLPVYTLTKAHGTRKETRIRHVRGDAKVLADALSKQLNLPLGRKEGVWVNHISGQVMIKGHFAQEVMDYLGRQGF